jgi:O-antigen/teichoic acid export membrane protein
LGTASAAIKFIAELRGGGHTEQVAPLVTWLRRAQRAFLIVVMAVGGLAFAVAGDQFAPGLDHLPLFGVMCIGVALRAPYMFNIGVAKGFEDFRATASVALLGTPVNLLLVLAAWLLHAPMEGFLAVYAVSSAVSWWLSRRQVQCSRSCRTSPTRRCRTSCASACAATC